MTDRSWRKAAAGAAKDSVAIKSGRSVQLGRTKDGKQTRAFGRPKLASLPNNPLAGSAERKPKAAECDESVPIEAVQQITMVMDPGVRRDDWAEF